jgi:RNA polymerase sigma-70 factor (ECF subfamily)
MNDPETWCKGVIADERRLVDRCLAGGESALQEFVERFQSLVYGVCVRMTGDRHEAEDVAQEVFVRALGNLHRWDRTRPLRPWLMTITANRCRTFLSRRRRRPATSDFPEDVPAAESGEVAANELEAEIQKALETLRPDYQTVFLLFHQQGLSYEEMSAIVGKPIGTIKTWLHRARGEMITALRARGWVEEFRHDLSGV